MGWIRKNWFWYEHHELHIEPTNEEKRIRQAEFRRFKYRAGQLITSAMILANMNNR